MFEMLLFTCGLLYWMSLKELYCAEFLTLCYARRIDMC